MSALPNPVLNPERATAHPALPEHTQPHLPNSLGSFGRWLGRKRAHLQSLIASDSDRESLLRKMRTRAVCVKDEHPMPLLGIMMAAAFAIGIATRIWSPYER